MVSGPEASALASALAGRGVEVPPPAGCPGPTVQVERTSRGVLLDGDDRPPRILPDIATAALVVETWIRTELADPLLEAREPPAPPETAEPTPASPAPGEPAPLQTTAQPPMPTETYPLHFELGLDVGASDDGATWLGLRGEGCVRLGRVCPGARLRLQVDPGSTGASQRTNAWRLGGTALAAVDLHLGRARLGLAAGGLLLNTDAPQEVEDTRLTPLAQAQAAYTIAPGEALDLELVLSVEHAFRGRGDRKDDGGLPEVAAWTGWLGVGVRWSTP